MEDNAQNRWLAKLAAVALVMVCIAFPPLFFIVIPLGIYFRLADWEKDHNKGEK